MIGAFAFWVFFAAKIAVCRVDIWGWSYNNQSQDGTRCLFEDAIMTVANDPQFDQDPDRLSWTDVDECGLQPAEASEASDE